MECWKRTGQYSLFYFLFAYFIVVVPHCYDICSHFFAVKFILLCSVYRVEDSHLITVQIIDALLPEDCSHSTKDNLISTIWINIIAPLTVAGKLCILSVNTYILPSPTRDVVKRKPIDRAWKEFFWFYLFFFVVVVVVVVFVLLGFLVLLVTQIFLFVCLQKEVKKGKDRTKWDKSEKFFFCSEVVNITPNRTAGLNRMCLNLVFGKFFLNWVVSIHYYISFRCITERFNIYIHNEFISTSLLTSCHHVKL